MSPATFPFLAISKKYGVDYGDVLLTADAWRNGSQGCRLGIPRGWYAAQTRVGAAVNWDDNLRTDIMKANAEFKAIQAGEVDWLTGARPPAKFDFDKLKRPDPRAYLDEKAFREPRG